MVILPVLYYLTLTPVFNESYLSDIAIKSEYRGMGVGRQLFTHMEEVLKDRNISWGWALVHEDNMRMQEMLEKRGFEKGRKFFFYSRG